MYNNQQPAAWQSSTNVPSYEPNVQLPGGGGLVYQYPYGISGPSDMSPGAPQSNPAANHSHSDHEFPTRKSHDSGISVPYSSGHQSTYSTQTNPALTNAVPNQHIPRPNSAVYGLPDSMQFHPAGCFGADGTAFNDSQQFPALNIPCRRTEPLPLGIRPAIRERSTRPPPSKPILPQSHTPPILLNKYDNVTESDKTVWHFVVNKLSKMEFPNEAIQIFTKRNFGCIPEDFVENPVTFLHDDATTSDFRQSTIRPQKQQESLRASRKKPGKETRQQPRVGARGRVTKPKKVKQLRPGPFAIRHRRQLTVLANLATNPDSVNDCTEVRCDEHLTDNNKQAHRNKIYDPSKKYFCVLLCGQAFTKYCSMERHIMQNVGCRFVCHVGRWWNDEEGRRKCSFCGEVNPTDEHLRSGHPDSQPCKEQRDPGNRVLAISFSRKDRLINHFQEHHQNINRELAADRYFFYQEPPCPGRGWQCGFCGGHFPTVRRWCRHFARQFEIGRKLSEWKSPWTASGPTRRCDTSKDQGMDCDGDDGGDGHDDDSDDDDDDDNDDDNYSEEGGQDHNPQGGSGPASDDRSQPREPGVDYGQGPGASSTGLDDIGHLGGDLTAPFSYCKHFMTAKCSSLTEIRINDLIQNMDTSLLIIGQLMNSKTIDNHVTAGNILWLRMSSGSTLDPSDQIICEKIQLESMTIQDSLGEGAHSQVHKVNFEDRALQLAKKRVRSQELLESDVQTRFLREFSVISWAKHPHIASLRGMFVTQFEWSFLIEPVADMTLREAFHIGQTGCLRSLFQAEDFGCIAAGVQYLHSYGIVHGDLKPENILLQTNGCFVICDFGTASTCSNKRPAEYTPKYAAPEIVAGGLASTSSDVYSLGITFMEIYQTLLGSWGAHGTNEMREAAKSFEKQSLCIDQMMQPDPSRRPPIKAVFDAFPSKPCCSYQVFAPGPPSALELLRRQERPIYDRKDILHIENYRFIRSLLMHLDALRPWALFHEDDWFQPRYHSLQARHIRLLRLARDSNKYLTAQLESFQLDSLPEFCVVSYVWGSARDAEFIHLDGSISRLSKSVSKALRVARRSLSLIYFWVDSLCINFSDQSERSNQVQLMRDIYRRASIIVVSIELSQKYLIQTESTINDATILHLATRPWFRSFWMCQELSAAQRAHVSLGKAMIPWKVFYTAFADLLSRSVVDTASIVVTSSASALRGAVEMLKAIEALANPRVKEAALSLSDLLKFFKRYHTTDPRDKVYALLAFRAEVDHLGLKIDYSRSVHDVYIETAQRCLENGMIDILTACSRHGPLSNSLPSWVPDWSATEHRSLDLPSFRAGSILVTRRFFPRFEMTRMKGKRVTQLLLRGIQVDIVDQLFPELKHASETDFWDYSSCLQRKKSFENRYAGHTFDAVFKTAVADREPNGPKGCGWRRLSYRVGGALITKQSLDKFASSTFWLTFRYLQRSRTMFLAEEGYLGLAPDHVIKGDLVVLLQGTRMPFILRQVEDDIYTLLGDAYVHGLMDGELMKEELNEEPKIIRLV